MKFTKTIRLVMITFSSLYLATAFSSEEIIKRKHYTLNYNEEHEVANWVSYKLEKKHLQNCVARANSFKTDPLVSTGSATVKDYANSGYDRGHLLPAGDMKFSVEAMRDTFYLSNITPQPAVFNRGRWTQLETLMRAWSLEYDKIWIVTGPVLEKGLDVIGQNNSISVPLKYFKVIIRQIGNSFEGIGFLMGTDVPHVDLKAYVMTIDEIEELTNHNYFQFLEPQVESKVESKVNLKKWNFNAKFEYFPCETSEAQ